MDNLIEVTGLTKTYGKKSSAFQALKGINLTIKKGESVAIIGKSGSGKSTLMHLLALLDRPTHGTITVDDINSTKLRPRQLNRIRNRRFGFVFQQFFMNPNDSVLANVLLPLKIAGLSRRTRKAHALAALKTVDLADKAKSKAKDLSGGQKQRVCIARAIVNHPEVIFADEPTGNLDTVTGERIERLLFDLNRDQGITLIVVTHDEELAKKCQRQIHIRDGLIESDSGTKITPETKSSSTKISPKAKSAKPTTQKGGRK
jgi:putative ABC transport system ATP-binding protein